MELEGTALLEASFLAPWDKFDLWPNLQSKLVFLLLQLLVIISTMVTLEPTFRVNRFKTKYLGGLDGIDRVAR